MSNEKKHDDFKQTPMMLINDCSRLFGRQIRKHSDELGFPNGYRELLMRLAFLKRQNSEGVAQNELAKMTHLSPPTVSATLEKLERDGLISRESDESDARRMRVKLTEKGYALDVENQEYAGELERRALTALDESEKAELRRLLIKIIDALTDEGMERSQTERSERKEIN